MNKAHAIWSILPAGFADAERTTVKLSLMVSIRAIADNQRLSDLKELCDWPSQVCVFDTVNVFIDGRATPVLAKVVSEKPSSELWTSLFSPDTRVELNGGGEVESMSSASSSVLFRPLTRALRGVYAAASVSPRTAASALAREQPLTKVLRGLAQWSALDLGQAHPASTRGAAASRAQHPLASVQADLSQLLEPTQITSARMEQAADLLRTRGLSELADTLPMALLLRRLRTSSASRSPAAAAPLSAAGPLDGTRAIDQADFHQILGLVSAHPSLALALGLRLDLTMPAIAGSFAMRTGGLPWQLAGGRPWSAVVCDPKSGRFTMASEPSAPTEIVNGMLDLRPEGAGADKYVLTTMDVVGMTEQLDRPRSST